MPRTFRLFMHDTYFVIANPSAIRYVEPDPAAACVRVHWIGGDITSVQVAQKEGEDFLEHRERVLAKGDEIGKLMDQAFTVSLPRRQEFTYPPSIKPLQGHDPVIPPDVQKVGLDPLTSREDIQRRFDPKAVFKPAPRETTYRGDRDQITPQDVQDALSRQDLVFAIVETPIRTDGTKAQVHAPVAPEKREPPYDVLWDDEYDNAITDDGNGGTLAEAIKYDDDEAVITSEDPDQKMRELCCCHHVKACHHTNGKCSACSCQHFTSLSHPPSYAGSGVEIYPHPPATAVATLDDGQKIMVEQLPNGRWAPAYDADATTVLRTMGTTTQRKVQGSPFRGVMSPVQLDKDLCASTGLTDGGQADIVTTQADSPQENNHSPPTPPPPFNCVLHCEMCGHVLSDHGDNMCHGLVRLGTTQSTSRCRCRGFVPGSGSQAHLNLISAVHHDQTLALCTCGHPRIDHQHRGRDIICIHRELGGKQCSCQHYTSLAERIQKAPGTTVDTRPARSTSDGF